MKMIPFSFENHAVRVSERDGAPWFIGKDVCEALGLSDVSDAVRKLDEDERGSIPIMDSIGRKQETLIISESGLYALALRCREAMTPAR